LKKVSFGIIATIGILIFTFLVITGFIIEKYEIAKDFISSLFK